MSDYCYSCGEEFIKHVGLIGTCQELLRVKKENEKLTKENKLLKIKLGKKNYE